MTAEQLREQYLELLTQRHAGRWGLPLEMARRHVDQVSVTANREMRPHAVQWFMFRGND